MLHHLRDLCISPKTASSHTCGHKAKFSNYAHIQLESTFALRWPHRTKLIHRGTFMKLWVHQHCPVLPVYHLQAVERLLSCLSLDVWWEKMMMHLCKREACTQTFENKLLTICFWLQSHVQEVIALSDLICVLCFPWGIISLHSLFYCLGNQTDVCLFWVHIWVSEASSPNNGRNLSKWGKALFLANLTDPSEATFFPFYLSPLPLSFSDLNYPLA